MSASAPGELAQPGGDRLLVASRLAPARRARLTGGDRIGPRTCMRDRGGRALRDESSRALGVVDRVHRGATLAPRDEEDKD